MATKKKKKKLEPTAWLKISAPSCDLCTKPAVWMHPLGGLRCSTCPRPDVIDKPCPRCLELVKEGVLRVEMLQPLPEGAHAPLAKVPGGKPCCYDCASADTVVRLGYAPDFSMARIAVGNDRQDQYRLPGAPMGLVQLGIVRASAPGDLERHHAWLDAHDWFEFGEET